MNYNSFKLIFRFKRHAFSGNSFVNLYCLTDFVSSALMANLFPHCKDI